MPSKLKPQAKGPKPPPPDYSEFKSLRKSKLPELAVEYRKWSVQEKEAKAKKKLLTEDLKPLMSSLPEGVKSVAASQLRVTLAHGKTASAIDGRKLLEQGVAPAVIQAATIPGKSYPYVVITPLDSDEEEDE